MRFAGAVPAAAFVRIDADPACVALNGGDRQPDETVVAGRDRGVPNTFVYVMAGLEKMTFPVPNEPVVLDQQRCRYLPRVVGVRVGQTLRLRNGDPLLHNVRSDGEVNQPFNQGQPVQGMTFDHTFTTREVMVPIACDVHRWMRAYVGALEHPYFAARGMVRRVPDPVLGEVTIPGFPFKFGALPELPDLRAPLLGEHNAEVLRERLGYDAARIATLEKGGVLISAPS